MRQSQCNAMQGDEESVAASRQMPKILFPIAVANHGCVIPPESHPADYLSSHILWWDSLAATPEADTAHHREGKKDAAFR